MFKQKKIIILLIIFSSALWSISASSIPEKDVAGKYGIYPDTDVDSLTETAKQAEFSLNNYKENGEGKLFAVSDFHAVFELDMDEIAEVIVDHDNGEKIFSRMVDTVDLNPDLDLTVPHRQRVHNSTKFLGIGADYIYTTRVAVERKTSDEFAMSWLMLESEEGNFEEYEGFWFLKKLSKAENGNPRTYVRLRAETLFHDVIPFQELIMGMFTAGETAGVFKSLKNAAENGY